VLVCAGDDMSNMLTRKEKSQTVGTLIPIFILQSYTISHTKSHDGRDHYLNYDNILDMFKRERFPFDDPDIEAYKNIKKREIHTILARPKTFCTKT